MQNNTCDLSKVTWPRHADGSCDYDNTNSIATASASENQGMEEFETANTIECAEPAEKEELKLQNLIETKDESERANEKADAKESSALPIIPIVVGVAVLAVLIVVILLAAKKKKYEKK